MKSQYEQILDRFGTYNQFEKLKEECLEFVEAWDEYKSNLELHKRNQEKHAKPSILDALWESSDILNVLRSIRSKNEVIDTMAATKLLRTQIRISNGYYDNV